MVAFRRSSIVLDKRKLKSNEPCISNPKSRNLELDAGWHVRGPLSNLRFRDFGFEMRDSFDFKISRPHTRSSFRNSPLSRLSTETEPHKSRCSPQEKQQS